MLEENYGGVEEYLKQYVKLSEDDINIIRNHILVSGNSRL